jgi:hypothetical protein
MCVPLHMCWPPDSWSTTIRCVTSKFIKSVYSAFNGKCYVEIHALILTAELFALLLRVREVAGSNLGSKNNYVEWDLSSIISVNPGKCLTRNEE